MITLKNVSKTYGSGDKAVVALKDASLTVPQGAITGVIGLSGAGKSTLIRCVNLLERPTAGSVVVDGQELTELDESALRSARHQIGMIFQHFNLLSSRTVFANVALPLELAGISKDEIKKARRAIAGADRPGRQGRPVSCPAVRRPETACGHRPCAGQPPQGAAV